MGKAVFKRPETMTGATTHYCPGCGHGIIHRLLAEVIDELGVREKTIGIAPVGCAVIAYDYWNFDCSEAPHGRTPAVATAVKRVLPDRIVFTYQGDGDLAAIGTAEIIHAANRSENITVIFVNNGVYAMTGGQLAPTTLLNQRTATTPCGRSVKRDGYPLKISEMIAVLDGARYIERTSVSSPKEVIRTRKALKRAFETQIKGEGFSMVEVLSMCPVYWGLSPVDACKRIEKEVVKYYPLGVIKG